MISKFELGSISVESGSMVCTEFPVIKKPDGHFLSIPMMIAHGVEDGPVVLAMGGSHGDEIEGPRAIITIAREIDPNRLKGTFLGIPFVNVPGLVQRASVQVCSRRENPIDFKDISPVFPGSPEGTITERVADIICNTLLDVADYCLDLHSGGGMAGVINLAGFCDEPGDYGKKSFEMAWVFPIEVLWQLPGADCPLRHIARKKNVPFFSGEAFDGEVEPYIVGLRNLLKHLSMVEGTMEGIPSKRRCVGPEVTISCRSAGLVIPHRKSGESVSRGDLLLTITDIYGNEVERIESPINGIVTGIRRTKESLVWPGDTVAFVAELIKEGRYFPKRGQVV